MFERQKFLIQRRLAECKLPIIENEIKWFIAGGALRAVFAGEMINDLDIYFESQDDFDKFKNKHFEVKELVFDTENALSYIKNNRKIQLIKKFYGNPADLIQRFDFTICQCAYVPYFRKNAGLPILAGTFEMSSSFLEHLSLRLLSYNVNGDHPINSLYRIVKYLKKGYTIPAVELVKLSLKINNLKIKTYQELRYELEGIDTILLKDFTDSLIDKKDNNYNFNEALGLITDYLEKKYNELRGCPDEDNSF